MADHALATITNPSSALTDFTLAVDLANMPASWWSAVTSADGTRGRVYKGDGTTRLACDWIDFDSTAHTGILRALWSGTLASSGTQQLWIEPPISGNAAVGVSDTYGQYSAYDANTWAYYPLHDTYDRTSNARTLTGSGSPTMGGVAGLVGRATDLVQASSQYLYTPDWVWTNAGTFSLAVKSDSVISDQAVVGDNNNNGNQIWRDEFGTTDRYGLYNGLTAVYGSTNPGIIWHIVAVSNSGSNELGLWVDGTMENSIASNFATRTSPIRIGNSGSIKYFDGPVQHFYVSSVRRAEAWIDEETLQIAGNATFYGGTWTWEGGSSPVPKILLAHRRAE